MANYLTTDADLASIADAIRTKGGTSARLAFPEEFVDAIEAISGGGGSATAATGEITLASDFALTTSAQNIPGLQLDFQPDFFYMVRSYDSWLEGTSFGGLMGILSVKKSMVAPYRITNNVSTESTEGDYLFLINTNAAADTSVSNGYSLNGISTLGKDYYPRFSVNSDGTISVGRYSSASQSMRAGTYRYFAVKA